MKSKGFTMIEIIIVISLISLLALVVLQIVNPITQLQKANDAKRKSDLAQIQRGLELYYQDNGSYPVSTGTYTITGASWGNAWGSYIAKLPKDPATSGRNYVYYSPSGNQSYYLYASLERGTNDPNTCNSGGAGICSSLSANSIAATACGGTCNYGVTSPNATP